MKWRLVRRRFAWAAAAVACSGIWTVAHRAGERHAAAAVVADDRRPSVRLYDVRDLLDAAEAAADRLDPGWRDRPTYTGDYAGPELVPTARYARSEASRGLVKMMTDSIRVETWQVDGGNNDVAAMVAGLIVVRQTPAGQRDVAAFLDQLRRPVPIGGPLTTAVAAGRAAGTVTRVYDVGPLLSATVGRGGLYDRCDRIAERLKAAVAPDSWLENGGTCGTWVYVDRLVVAQTDAGHRAVAAALSAMKDGR